MNLFQKLKMKRAKRHLNRALKIVSKLSWEEIDTIIPRHDYTNCFKKSDWGNVEMKYDITSLKGYKESEGKQ